MIFKQQINFIDRINQINMTLFLSKMYISRDQTIREIQLNKFFLKSTQIFIIIGTIDKFFE